MDAVNHTLLKLVREARGMTQSVLAEESGLAQGSISKYEKGLVVPDEEQLGRIASATGYEPAFFRDEQARPASVLYRSRSLRSAKLEAKVRARLNLGRLVAQRLLDGVDIERVASFPAPDENLGNPEQAATVMRQAWWVPPGPVPNVCDLIENAGGIILRMDLGTENVVAAYMHPLGDSVRWFFVNTRVHAGDRVRFSLAHELGHAVLHESDLLSDSRQAERQSHWFAGAFLVPAAELRAELPRTRLQLSHLYDLKARWGVAMQMLAVRAAELGAIGKTELARLYRELNYRGWRTVEPGSTPLERPTVLAAALDVHRTDHGLNDRDLARFARVRESALHDLFPEHFAGPTVPRLRVVSRRGVPGSTGTGLAPSTG